MNKEDYVSYDLAVKLKEAGFDWPCTAYFGVEPDGKPDLWLSTLSEVLPCHLKGRDVIAPTLYLAQKWLRKEHRVSIRINFSQSTKNWFYDILKLDDNGAYADGGWDEYYSDYEPALSAGISTAIDFFIL